jgi:cob(I)alamin adenosyltransferase
MSSISTKRGDDGQTSLADGTRVSKSHLRVETYGTIDELNATMGFARSLCQEPEINQLVKIIQQQLFTISASLATTTANNKFTTATPAMVLALTEQVQRLEQVEGMLSDWSIAGEHTIAAAFDMARTVCRRAERHLVRLLESGEAVDSYLIPYFNRLSDLLWLIGRWLELQAGVDARLKPNS